MSDAHPLLYCANHPTVETTLRCNRCEKPICPKCAVLTPTGYRCKDCVRGQQKIFDTAEWYDYPLAFCLAGLLGFIGSLVVGIASFFMLLLAPVVGMVIAEVVRFVVRRRRSHLLHRIAALAAALGSLPIPLLALLQILLTGSTGGLLSLLWYGLYTFLVTSTVYYRLGGIQVR